MISAHSSYAGEAGERERLVRVAFDPMQRRADPPLIGSAWRRRPAGRSGERRDDRSGKAVRNFFKLRSIAVVPRRFRRSDDRQ
jgi:hypothetical protein